jgi:hypothetical protein
MRARDDGAELDWRFCEPADPPSSPAIVEGSRDVGINQGDAVPRESIPALVELHLRAGSRSTSSSASTRSTASNRRPTTPPQEPSSSPC